MTESILDDDKHRMLIADMSNVCQQSGVPPKYIHTSMRNYCNDAECTWVAKYHSLNQTGKCGLLLVGQNIETRCLAISGALIRNYLDARVVTLQTVIDDGVDPTILVIPNFYISAIDTKPHPSWKVDQVYSILLERMSTGQQTILGVTSMNDLKMVYGDNVFNHLTKNYITVEHKGA